MRSALLAGDIDGYVSFFSSDCSAIVHTGERIVGSAALEYRTRQALDRQSFFSIEIRADQTLAFDSRVFESGRYFFEIERDGVRLRIGGRFNAVWKRERDGWKIAFEAVRPES